MNIKDTYFTNIEQAYLIAELKQKITDEHGQDRMQMCYYDGPLTDIPLENFIQVPQNDFVHFFSNNSLPIPTIIQYENEDTIDLLKDSPDIIEDIENYRKNRKMVDLIHVDLFFLDQLLALNTAKQRNRTYLGHPTIDGLQVCYYHGEPLEHQYENLINLNLHEIIKFFTTSTLRLPKQIIIPDELDEELKEGAFNTFQQSLESIKTYKEKVVSQLILEAKNIKPDFENDHPWRVFLPSNRMTQVMQYSSKGIEKSFKKLGLETLLEIEENEMAGFNIVNYLINYIKFKPHITFNINHLNNAYLNDDIYNIVWYQDLMPALTDKKTSLNIRNRDSFYILHSSFDPFVKEKKIKQFERQTIGFDDETFKVDETVERENKIVFIGSSYGLQLNLKSLKPTYSDIYQEYVERLNAGLPINKSFAEQIAAKYSVDDKTVYPLYSNYIVRDGIVEWLCDLAEQDIIKVEIYGRYWEHNPIVSPFYCGELSHGPEVARVYQSARYALCATREEITNQRLIEVSACGAIPLVYDVRNEAEKPHWEDECLYFNSKSDLIACLNRKPVSSPVNIAKQNSYFHFAEKIINKIKNDQQNES